MPTVCVSTRKGGVGKTTVAVQLALALAADGEQCTVIDADRQRTAAEWLDAAGPVERLAYVTVDDASGMSRAVRKVPVEQWVIIDSPPGVGDWPTTIAAMAAADVVVVPVRPTIADLRQWNHTATTAAEAGTVAVLLLSQTRPATRSARFAREALDELDNVPAFEVEIPMREGIAATYGTSRVAEPFPELLAELRETLTMIANVRKGA